MNSALVSLLFAFATAFFHGAQSCSTAKLGEPINWTELNGEWMWAMNGEGPLTDILRCSGFSVTQRGKSSQITMHLKYGPNAHQVITYEAEHVKGNNYLLTEDFTSSWINIIRHRYLFENKSILSGVTGERSSISFYTDKGHNYLTAAICMPNGKEAVWAFTKHRHTTPRLQDKIRKKLTSVDVTTPVMKTKCLKREENNKKADMFA